MTNARNLAAIGSNGSAVMPNWTTGTRPASPRTGQQGFNTTLNTMEFYNGSAWATVVGATGINGASGIGATGIQGASGATGVNGASGIGATGVGVQGASGSTGLSGATGSTGIQGASGTQSPGKSIAMSMIFGF
jgi:hypothetical protein